MRKSRGITLIALIITIVVLLILAVVAIGAVQNDGIIEHAKNARKEYETAQNTEQTALNTYLDILNENDPKNVKWTQNKTTVTNGTITLNVGDTVAYDETKGGTVEVPVDTNWKVLGAENGKILLMSTTDVGEVELYGRDDYIRDLGIRKINTACEGYNNGIGAAEDIKSRSIKVEDIDRITGFDKTTYGKGEVDEYGNEVTYTLGADGDTVTVKVKGKPDFKNTFSIQGHYGDGVFYWPVLTYYLEPGETYTAEKNTFYSYQGKTYFPNTTNDPVYVMLFRNDANSKDAYYWLGSSYASAEAFGASFGVCIIERGGINEGFLWSSYSGMRGHTIGVRSVVYLNSDVKLAKNGTNAWKIVENN